ncbi:AAA family ATPase [Thermophilibacter immobilis]|uniref:AAA family ATPase n=1 Tax=Thermophilibacter immobilis TaxID=2779519 RepID=UPI001E4877BF|nr:AAA family ATPase [Thermophilibacter immobilis]
MLFQALGQSKAASHFVSADDPLEPSAGWLRTEWQQARNMVRAAAGAVTVLIVDGVQKVDRWPTVAKSLWDADRRAGLSPKVFLSGSSSLLLHKGLEDSLMGRFELIHSPTGAWVSAARPSDTRLTTSSSTEAIPVQRALRPTRVDGRPTSGTQSSNRPSLRTSSSGRTCASPRSCARSSGRVRRTPAKSSPTRRWSGSSRMRETP